VPEGDIMLAVVALAPTRFEKPVCEVDWAVRVLLDEEAWDVGGLGDLEPGSDTGPPDECGCLSVAQGDCPSMIGEWTLNYFWDKGSATIWFYPDGTFYVSDGYIGTWHQDGCDVEWFYESGTHYWGVMNPDGDSMDGEMLSSYGGSGHWNATRNAASVGLFDSYAVHSK
jgi:hypothetical protein